MSNDKNELVDALVRYSEGVRSTRGHPSHSPETSLYSDLEALIRSVADLRDHPDAEVIQQYRAKDIGAPDFGVETAASTSYVEAKPPKTRLDDLTGADSEQFERYMRLDNIIYTNYHELRLFQGGELIGDPVQLVPKSWLDPRSSDRRDPNQLDAVGVANLFDRFLEFHPPRIRSVEQLATELAHATWLVRDAVEAAVAKAQDKDQEGEPLEEIYHEFRDVLFYELAEEEFADAYAQTLAYGLLLARQTTDSRITERTLASFIEPTEHHLLSATLRLLSQPQVLDLVGWTVDNLIGVVNQVEPEVLEHGGGRDPLLYFYEDFLGAYDPSLRKERGVYYTPTEVVDLQTRVIDHLLQSRYHKRYGFADGTVKTLDPGVGTGTYLISALDSGCDRVKKAIGEDSIKEAAAEMASRLHGFEILVGPYTVAHFRVSAALRERDVPLEHRLPIVLTDTLLPPGDHPDVPTHFGFMSEPLNEERKRADRIKQEEEIMVVLGNPPYQRRKSETGWIWDTLMEDFKKPVREKFSVDFKNLSERSIWFHRWAHWKLFESDGAPERGILSFISNRSYLIGGAFGGMRKVYRNSFDRIYILDLHGDSRAPLPAGVTEDENIFSIRVGVAICVCIADGSKEDDEAEVQYYGETWGSAQQKLRWLENVDADLTNVPFEVVHGSGTDPFFPGLGEAFRSWPQLKNDVFDYSISGIETKRDHLVVAPTREKLKEKITGYLQAHRHKQPELFHETRDQKSGPAAKTSFDPERIKRYAYRPLDRQYLYDHPLFVEYNRQTSLQRAWGSDNIALFTLPSGHGAGPAAFAHGHLPDRHAYRGSYGGYAFVLWNEAASQDSGQMRHDLQRVPNFEFQLLKGLSELWGERPNPVDLFAYIYAVLSAPSYTLEFGSDLARSFPRIPFPRNGDTYQRGVAVGTNLVALHTFRDTYPADGSLHLEGSPKSVDRAEFDASEGRVFITEQAWVGPVSSEVWNYQVSGYEVLQEWLSRRRDVDFTLELRKELLDVVWALHRTVKLGPELDELLSDLLSGGTFTREELGFSPEEKS